MLKVKFPSLQSQQILWGKMPPDPLQRARFQAAPPIPPVES